MPNTNELDGTQKVLVFYSSKTEPQLLDLYRESITYLKELSVDTEVVDITEDRGLAQEYDVIATPTVIVQSKSMEKRHLGLLDGLKDVLEEDIYGKSLLHQMGFKEGRQFAREHELHGECRETVEKALRTHLLQQGVNDFQITGFDPDECSAQGTITPDPDNESKQNWHAKVEEFLGGVFTEVFDTGVMGAETKCVDDGYDQCVFIVGKTQ